MRLFCKISLLLTYRNFHDKIINIKYFNIIQRKKHEGGKNMKKKNIFGFLKFLEFLLLIAALVLSVASNVNVNRIKKQVKQIQTDESKEQIDEVVIASEVDEKSSEEQIQVAKQSKEEQYEQFANLYFEYSDSEKEYKEKTGNIVFYSDPKCQEQIGTSETLVFASRNYALLNVEDKKVYAYMLKDGTICYCKGDENVLL